MHETKTSINNLSQRTHLCTTFQSRKLNIANIPEAFPPASSQSRSLPSPQRCSLSLCLTLEFSFPCFSGFYQWNHVSALLRIVSDLHHSTFWWWDPPMPSHATAVHLFLLYRYLLCMTIPPFYLPILLLMYVYVVSNFNYNKYCCCENSYFFSFPL